MENLDNKRKMTVMVAIMVALFFSAINQTIIGVAMPRIIASLGGMNYYTWVITIYLLTSTVATVLVGKLSDIYGRKPFILAGIILFMAGSLLSGFSTSIFHLIFYRGISGMGAGIVMSTGFMAVGDLYAPRERARWTGLLSGIFGLSSLLGPAAGGYIVDHFDWHWVFWVFLPLGIVAFVMILALFPKVERKQSESIDYIGSLFLTITIVALLLAFTWAGDGPEHYAWSSWQILSLFSCSAFALILFLITESKVKSPVLPLTLFQNRIVTLSNCIAFFMGAGMMGAMIYIPFFVQGVKGISPLYSGYIMMPMSILMAISTAVAGQWVSKTGKYKKIAVMGLAIMAGAMILLYSMDIHTPVYLIVAYMSMFGFGLGVSMPIFSLTVQNAVEPKDLGVVTASSQLFRSLGSTIGIAVFGMILSSQMADKLKAMMLMNPSLAQSAQSEKLRPLMNSELLLDQPKLVQIQQQLPPDYQTAAINMIEIARESFSFAITSVFLAGAVIMAVSVILTLFLREIPLRSAKDQVKEHAKQPIKLLERN